MGELVEKSVIAKTEPVIVLGLIVDIGVGFQVLCLPGWSVTFHTTTQKAYENHYGDLRSTMGVLPPHMRTLPSQLPLRVTDRDNFLMLMT